MPPTVDTLLKLRPRLRDALEKEDGWIVASFDYDPKDTNATALVTELHSEGVISEIRRGERRIYPPAFGEASTLSLRIDTGKLPGYFETYDSLIKGHPDISPEELTVWEKNEAFRAGYQAACTLVQFLKSKAEVWDATERRFFLVDQQAVEIPLTSYSARQTEKLPPQLKAVMRFLDMEHLDADARWAFFRKGCLRLLRDLPKETRLGALMENLSNVFDRAQQDHSLYLERFSFEDLLKNFDEKRFKFVSDLNQILASIQTALIAVPIGFFLIAEKFKPTNGWIGLNLLMAVGGLMFFGVVFILSLNQGKTLEGVRLGLAEFEAEQNKKITEQSARLKSLLTTTWDQYRRVHLLLQTVRILLVLFFVVIFIAFLWCSIPAWQQSIPYTGKDATSLAATNDALKLTPPVTKTVDDKRLVATNATTLVRQTNATITNKIR